MTYVITYTPRVQDEVIVATFDTLEEAKNHMELIEKEKPHTLKYHRIEEIREWPWQDSGVEQGL